LVRICSEITFFRCRAEASERRQSAFVIVLNSGPLAGSGEGTALDAGGFPGEDIEHEPPGVRSATDR
jgi:hypothetical protein